jgi:hypothetical protein
MKGLSVIISVFLLLFGAAISRAQNLDRMSAATGVPVETLQAERASTGLGWGSLEKAHLLANATGHSFKDLVAQHQAGQGWGKIAHDNGLNLGRLVSDAHRSSQATMHAQNTQAVHGKNARTARGRSATTVRGKSATTARAKSATNVTRGRTARTSTTRGVRHSSTFRSGLSGSHGMHSMGHMSGPHGMGSMGHGGGRR